MREPLQHFTYHSVCVFIFFYSVGKMSSKSCVIVFCFVTLVLDVSDVLTMTASDSPPRVCIIGAGYSGLGTARYMKQYGLNFTVYEASRHIGGTWRFDPHVGKDEDGLPIFTSMYKNLRTNTPRQTMEYTGFPFPEDTPSYPTGECFYKYLQAFVKHFDLMKHIQLRSYVTKVTRMDDHWELTFMETDTRQNITEKCGFIVVASGELSSPAWPKIDKMELFQGRMMHSHDYKDPSPFRNRRVLLVGAGASGLDLAVQLVNVTSRLIHSHHLKYKQPNFPIEYVKKPDISEFSTSGAMFVDGSTEDFDDVIFCTGYNFNHNFLDSTTGVTATKKFVLPLYQFTVNIKYPSMTFVGVSRKVINRVMDVQGQFAALLASGKVMLPPQGSMLRRWLDNVYTMRSKGMKILQVNVIGDDMEQYFANMTKEADVTRAPPVLTSIRDFNTKNRLEDLLNYRDYDYKIKDDFTYERYYNPRTELECPLDV